LVERRGNAALNFFGGKEAAAFWKKRRKIFFETGPVALERHRPK
jgi:hypothetical protein